MKLQQTQSGAFGPRFFRLPEQSGTAIVELHEDLNIVTAGSLLSFWYFHLPNFVLAALMYTLLGRAMLGLFVDADSPNYIWRFFCRITDPVVAAVSVVTPKAVAPVVLWLFGFVWLFWLRVALLYLFLLMGAVPQGN